jgi:putative Holliday junction resolvase
MGVINRVYVGVDVGEKRIGLSRSDPLGILATPVKTLTRKSTSSDIDALLRFAAESGALEIVVGMPISLSGAIGSQALITREFVKALADQSHVPVREQDERMSSVEAEGMLRAAGKKPSRNKASIDSAAAAVILQRYLDYLNA